MQLDDVPRGRLAFMLGVALFMIANPLARQVLGVSWHALRGWTMFSSFGDQICDVRFVRRGDGAEEEAVDRLEVLSREGGVAERDRHVRNKQGVLAQASRLCRLEGNDPRLHLWARCGDGGVWKTVVDGAGPICPALSGERR